MSKENENSQDLNRSQKRAAEEKRREEKIRRASENGSIVLQLHSGDEMYSLISLIPQLDRGFSILQQRTRRFSQAEVKAVNERIIRFVDEALTLTKDVCELAEIRFWIPRPLQADEQTNVKTNVKNVKISVDKKEKVV